MKRLLPCLLTLLVLLSSCATQNATTDLTSEAWRDDLRYLARELPTRHVNAFHTISRESFAVEVARLDAAIPHMNGDEVIVALMRLTALIGDGHTHLDLPPSHLRYPLELQWFGEELRVVAVSAPYHGAVGARVRGIGSKTISDLMTQVIELVPRGENDGRTRLTATMQFTSPEVLHGLGVVADRGNAPFALELVSGERLSMTISPSPLGDFSDWRLATGEKPPLYLQHLSESWWTNLLPDNQTIYFSFNSYPPDSEFRERSTALSRMLDDSHARRLVIDLRRNQGGDFDRFRRLLLPVIKARAALNRKGGVFVITGPGTFSAAAVNALDLRKEVNAVIVGAPTGMKPSHYGERGEFQLPNSGFRISYSRRYHRFGVETDSAIFPDRHIEPTWAEFRSGRDPVMEWILLQTD